MFPFEQLSIEMLVVFAFGLMVLGPKDLPVVMRRIGQFVAKLRGMAAEFRASFDELARQSELEELRKEVEALRTGVHGAIAAPDPAYAYKPYEEPAAPGEAGFTFPSTTEPSTPQTSSPQTSSPQSLTPQSLTPQSLTAEPEPAAPRAARKTRAKKAAEPTLVAETPAAPASKPDRKPRASKPAGQPAIKAGSGSRPARRTPPKGGAAKGAAE